MPDDFLRKGSVQMANEEKTVSTKNKKPNWFKRRQKGIINWFRGMKSELKKVVWPTRSQIINNTAVALVVMAASAVVIWGFDQIASMTVNLLISIAR
jgi:preprotein translocase subunit SecE